MNAETTLLTKMSCTGTELCLYSIHYTNYIQYVLYKLSYYHI